MASANIRFPNFGPDQKAPLIPPALTQTSLDRLDLFAAAGRRGGFQTTADFILVTVRKQIPETAFAIHHQKAADLLKRVALFGITDAAALGNSTLKRPDASFFCRAGVPWQDAEPGRQFSRRSNHTEARSDALDLPARVGHDMFCNESVDSLAHLVSDAFADAFDNCLHKRGACGPVVFAGGLSHRIRLFRHAGVCGVETVEQAAAALRVGVDFDKADRCRRAILAVVFVNGVGDADIAARQQGCAPSLWTPQRRVGAHPGLSGLVAERHDDFRYVLRRGL